MKVDLDTLATGSAEMDVRLDLKTGASDIGPGRISLNGSLLVEDLSSRVLISGTLEARGETSCDRCLDDFEHRFDVPVEIVILRGSAQEEESDACLIEQRNGVVDLVPALRELSVLAMPVRRVPPEDEKGCCTICGLSFLEDESETEETDPRWDGLP